MNTIATTRLTHAVMIAAVIAAVFVTGAAKAAPADAPRVVTLPKVMVTGHRLVEAKPGVVVLPRVVVTGRRIDEPQRQVVVASR